MTQEIDPLSKIPGHTFKESVVLEEERRHLKIEKPGDATGLAISGGGIRSASFGLGVMQALVKNDVLKRIDYMSTVSGGGYLGAALTWALAQRDKNGNPVAGTAKENFPLGKKVNPLTEEKEPFKERNKLLDFIRWHGHYLTPTSSLGMLSFAGVVLRSMVLSVTVYVGMCTVLMTLGLWALYRVTGLAEFMKRLNMPVAGVLLFAGGALLAVMIGWTFVYSVGTFTAFKPFARGRYQHAVITQKAMGWMIKIGLIFLVLGSLPFVTKELDKAFYVPTASTLFGGAVGLWQYMKARKGDASSGLRSDILIYLGAMALLYGVLLFAYVISVRVFLAQDGYSFERLNLFLFAVGATIFAGFLTNLNLIGPHDLWRSRLMETFLPNRDAVEKNEWQRASEADGALMENMCATSDHKPYHIINTNVILPNSPRVDHSSRGGDSFMISPLYCGSSATGWKETAHFQKKSGRGMTLATAMAASAAALNPNAAVSGEGMTRNRMVSMLLSLLNLRLGYWTCNPCTRERIVPPNFFTPGLWSELLRFGMNEKSARIQLSDGGHYENLALYELVRRKLGLIILSDGGADASFNFDDLANAVEKVRVDFGAKIEFIKEYMLDNILPGTLHATDFQKKYGIAKYGYAVAGIDYDDGTKGVLLYLKLSMIEDLSTDVFSYKGVNPTFPHQSTTDQFFDEKQFEAYRELGYYIAKQMMGSAKLNKSFNPKEDQAKWLENLMAEVNPVKKSA